MKWIVELERETWIAPWSGDPGRTVVMHNARKFGSKRAAELALRKARCFRQFKNATIISATSKKPACGGRGKS